MKFIDFIRFVMVHHNFFPDYSPDYDFQTFQSGTIFPHGFTPLISQFQMFTISFNKILIKRRIFNELFCFFFLFCSMNVFSSFKEKNIFFRFINRLVSEKLRCCSVKTVFWTITKTYNIV